MGKPLILYKRHFTKAITWRLFSSAITFFIAYFFLKDELNAFEKALELVLLESFLKIFFYFIHERIWYNIALKFEISATARHILKSFTYRSIASIGTVVVVFCIFGENEAMAFAAGKIVVSEILIKLVTYYIHERIWYRFNYGVIKNSDE